MHQQFSRKNIVNSFIWQYIGQSSVQITQFILSIILARLLTPEEFGIIGLTNVFIAIAMVFAQSGLGQGLIQKRYIQKKDFLNTINFSIIFSICIYIILYYLAPIIAGIYGDYQIISIIRLLGLSIIFGAINSVQQAYLQKRMLFKKIFIANLLGAACSFVVGTFMAYYNMGVWALVGQQLINQIAIMLFLWINIKWLPTLKFSFSDIKSIFSFGWKILCTSLVDTIYNNIYSLIIGKFYSASDLGFYNRGKQFPMLVIQNINGAIDSVLFPVLSNAQDEKTKVKNMISRTIKISTFLIFPAMAGLAAIAKPITVLLLTEKWLPAVPFIWFCCFSYAFWPVQTANLQAIKALGHSDVILKLEIIKKLMGISVLVITLPFGLKIMMFARCITVMVSFMLNSYPNKKLLNYSYLEQVKDFFPAMLLSLFMCVVVVCIGFLELNYLFAICIQLCLGIIVYIGSAKLFKLEAFEYIFDITKSAILTKKD